MMQMELPSELAAAERDTSSGTCARAPLQNAATYGAALSRERVRMRTVGNKTPQKRLTILLPQRGDQRSWGLRGRAREESPDHPEFGLTWPARLVGSSVFSPSFSSLLLSNTE